MPNKVPSKACQTRVTGFVEHQYDIVKEDLHSGHEAVLTETRTHAV